MKVGTDGVLLGAWADPSGCLHILDAGTGTGLLALMMAQRCKALIDAIDIDPSAAGQAVENVRSSPWSDRIRVSNVSFQEFAGSATGKYDLVVCNPPYFRNSLKPNNRSRTIARHSDNLEPDELLRSCVKVLRTEGRFCLILPSEQEEEFISLSAQNGLFPSKILRIKPVPGKPFHRVLMELGFCQKPVEESEMVIEANGRHGYSPEYISLTADFYPGFSRQEERIK
jgi:tRNA1Val (adenine37-N6)-methyltransferase